MLRSLSQGAILPRNVLIEQLFLARNITGGGRSISTKAKHTYPQEVTNQRWTESPKGLGGDSPQLITIPLRVQKRLEAKTARENSRLGHIERQTRVSRRGKLSKVVISAKKSGLNHYYGQSYGSKEALALITKGWGGRKSVEDFFTIHPYDSSLSFSHEESDGPHSTFDNLNLSNQLTSKLSDLNMETPTIVQTMAIPKIMSGSSVIVSAETGSGKTLAYLLPVFQHILRVKQSRLEQKSTRSNQPLAIVIVPTRELAEQIFQVATKLSVGLNVKVKHLEGGNLGSKISNPPNEEVDIVISTLNVISTFGKLEVYSFKRVEQVVLDEADTLLDDSFSPALLHFLQHFKFNQSSDRSVQGILVSATFPKSVDTVLEEIFPVGTIERVITPGLHRILPNVTHKFFRIRKSEKLPKVLEYVKMVEKSNVPLMIFCNKTSACNWLAIELSNNGVQCLRVNGQVRIPERRGRLDLYHEGEVDIVICTDIASRGIDSVRTGHVLNYDFPRFKADYIHRAGRTGRVGSSVPGVVTNFITRRSEIELVQEIEIAARKETSLSRVNANIKRILNTKYGMYKPIEL